MNWIQVGFKALPQTPPSAELRSASDRVTDPASAGLRVAGGGGLILLAVAAGSVGAWPAAVVAGAIGAVIALRRPAVRRDTPD